MTMFIVHSKSRGAILVLIACDVRSLKKRTYVHMLSWRVLIYAQIVFLNKNVFDAQFYILVLHRRGKASSAGLSKTVGIAAYCMLSL